LAAIEISKGSPNSIGYEWSIMTKKDAGKSYAAFSQQLWEGDYDKALKSIDSAIAIDPDPSLLIVKGVFLFELGRTGGESRNGKYQH